MTHAIQQELDRRTSAWRSLVRAGGPKHVEPSLPRKLGIYGGAQGIWVDKARTAHLTDSGTGVTVGLLHTGRHYADDFDESGVLYHYPETGRPPGRDQAEVEATKTAANSKLPVFVITSPSHQWRDVYLGWIQGWDDEARVFLVAFQVSPPAQLITETAEDETPFSLTQRKGTKKREVDARDNQQKFKFDVLKRYGPYCAVCGIGCKDVLDAVHLRPKSKNGSDDSRNGLVLCAIHHRALDAYLFAIHPKSLELHFRRKGPDAKSLRITYSDICHLRKKPHETALAWKWSRSEANKKEHT